MEAEGSNATTSTLSASGCVDRECKNLRRADVPILVIEHTDFDPEAFSGNALTENSDGALLFAQDVLSGFPRGVDRGPW